MAKRKVKQNFVSSTGIEVSSHFVGRFILDEDRFLRDVLSGITTEGLTLADHSGAGLKAQQR